MFANKVLLENTPLNATANLRFLPHIFKSF